MASVDRGTKRQCLHCGTKYYDLNREPILCPACEKPYEPPVEVKSRKSQAESSATTPAPESAAKSATPAPEAEPASAKVAEFADTENNDTEDEEDTGKDIPDVEEVEDIGGEVDNAFVENDDDGNESESDIGLGVNTTKDED